MGRSGSGSTKTTMKEQLADGVLLLGYKARAVEEHAQAHPSAPKVNPVMFVVASKIEEANEAAELLAADDMIGSKNGVLVVTSESTEESLLALQSVEEPDSPVRAIVAVDMLGLGWDVANIYVVVALRAMESQALSEQILGRGLRLPYGERTGVELLDTVEVVSHRKFKELLDKADVLLENVLPESPESTTPATPANPATGGTNAPVGNESEFSLEAETDDRGVLSVTTTNSEGEAATTAVVTDIESRKNQNEADLDKQESITRVDGAPEIPFPRLETRIRPLEFSLLDVKDPAVAKVGKKFRHSWEEFLHREALNAVTDDAGQVTIKRTVLNEPIEYGQQSFDVDDLFQRLTAKLVNLDFVESSRAGQKAAAKRIVTTFLEAADVPESGECDWGEAQAAAAVNAFAQLIRDTKREVEKNRMGREEYVRIVGYPPPTLKEPLPVYDKGSVGDANPFKRFRWYGGWEKCMLSAARFDAESTEWVVAKRLDAAKTDVVWWVNIERNNEVEIILADEQRYTPDFIVMDADGIYWLIETKSDDAADTQKVITRKEAAKDWVSRVNDYQAETTGDQWRYLFVTEADLKNATTWGALISLAAE